ncbi:carbohydrate ABC transporter permease [Fodinicola feengrottensis]|uniref:Carbohydrate ABC transporter permease n=1 Tax=Fodinicola feengrottensis TaxID=435914 RepID=A0ABN2HDG3_9ACTN
MSATTATATRKTGKAAGPVSRQRKPIRPARIALHAFLILVTVSFLFPLLLAFYTSFRTQNDTALHGYFSLPDALTVQNYVNAFTQGNMPLYFGNTILVTVPSIILILALSSMVAFGLARFRLPGRKALLVMFVAGNLLPPQIMLTPLYRLYNLIPLPDFMSDSQVLYDSYWGIIAIHVAFQIGFCTFVLTNYMEVLPKELTESALVDGAGAWKQYTSIILPLCRPPLAALATLEFTWIYNDFLWALVLMSTGDKRPITSALNNLKGEFFTDNNLLAAGSLIIALPTMIVYFALQKQFISGLTLGANKG